MSYSRWTSSRWYTYWLSTIEQRKQWQQFAICDFGRGFEFTYKQISLDIDKCLDEVCEYYSKSHTVKMLKNWNLKSDEYEEVELNPQPVSQAERDELKGYMLQFIEDVDKEYEKKDKGSRT